MAKYIVTVRETLTWDKVIEADNEQAAVAIAQTELDQVVDPSDAGFECQIANSEVYSGGEFLSAS